MTGERLDNIITGSVYATLFLIALAIAMYIIGCEDNTPKVIPHTVVPAEKKDPLSYRAGKGAREVSGEFIRGFIGLKPKTDKNAEEK